MHIQRIECLSWQILSLCGRCTGFVGHRHRSLDILDAAESRRKDKQHHQNAVQTARAGKEVLRDTADVESRAREEELPATAAIPGRLSMTIRRLARTR